MYAKLALRNACRSLKDYALYLTTMLVLTVLINFSNLISGASSLVDGVQASSLPLIIALIMAVLLHYINGFMLRRRGRELATYTLLGMNKRTISTMFFAESFLLGIACFVIGTILGSLIFFLTMNLSISNANNNGTALYEGAAISSFLYFVAVQLICGILSYLRILKLQIGQLMVAGHKNEVANKSSRPILWSILFGISFCLYLLMLYFITNSTSQTLVMMSTSIIAIPLLFSIFAFYKCFFLWLNWFRKNNRTELYRNDRIYLTATTLSKFTTDTRLYSVLSVCLLFSAACFIVGIIMNYVPSALISSSQAEWMSFVQICLSITFIIIYFSILSVKQIIDTQDSIHGLRLMGYLGKSKIQLKKLLLRESCLKFTIPIIACALMLSLIILPLNSMLNEVLSDRNILVGAIGIFAVCFCGLYLIYLAVVYKLCRNA